MLGVVNVATSKAFFARHTSLPHHLLTFLSLQVLVEKLGVMDAATSKAFAAKRSTSPEDYPEPVSRAYAARWVTNLDR